jgi:hypothetical protein
MYFWILVSYATSILPIFFSPKKMLFLISKLFVADIFNLKSCILEGIEFSIGLIKFHNLN